MSKLEPVTSIIVTVIGGMILFFSKRAYEKYRNNRDKKQRKEWVDRLQDISDMISAEERLLGQPEIDRVGIFEISNGGEKPSPGRIMYSKCVSVKTRNSEGYVRDNLHLKSKYAKVELDSDYIRMVIRVISDPAEPYRIDPGQIEDTLLSDIYKAEGVKYSEVYFLSLSGKKHRSYIISISTHQDDEQFNNPLLRSRIRSEVRIISGLFKTYQEIS